jgi:UDP-N-acetylmuramate: L-alanyl-gamma-D-glutamyl-meso-diaminopimelate ligase
MPLKTFEGASKRLQLLAQGTSNSVFLDFAHSPSKLKATIEAVRELYPARKLVVCFELHTFSSLTKDFLVQYNGTLTGADVAYVFLQSPCPGIEKIATN